ncbi:hypothetical protein NECAME_05075 [Necator americanus]|uniref:Uncharacterized protein n=1 Tax=Necator americanus TaxID=51031 RepID=W2SJS0_NECAM|nr:hypothetical protein NECAME_05075 [Necator americanus]ETN69889.1 hypothetical protein NECAME_05075 [Necator americanus]
MFGRSQHNGVVQVGSRTFEAQELQKLIPQLEEAIQRKDQQLKAQQGTVENHIRRIAELEAEVTSLQILPIAILSSVTGSPIIR